MGKRQHQKDKLYLTTTEWSQLYGGRRATADLERDLLKHFKRLPFGHCCLSLQPIRDAYCNDQGYVFDLTALVPFVQKHKMDPISGSPIDLKQFTKLTFARDSDNQLQCPILFKVFNENSHIVAIKTTGNVYSYEAVEQLNLKSKNYRDLLTDEPFTRKDVITLQEPSCFEKQDVSKFHYQVNALKWDEEEEAEADGKPRSNVKNMNQIMKAAMDEMQNSECSLAKGDFFYKEPTAGSSSGPAGVTLDRFNSATYSTGKVAASLTSTCMPVHQKVEVAYIGDDAYRYEHVRKNGYVQLLTNLGALNLELLCKDAPRTCDNFIRLCKRGYYNDTIFHRLIKHFVLQGGDPTGTGKGGESSWGAAFNDELDNNLAHDKRGMLSMANSGKNTNKSQFYITLKSCPHLNKKHTIFGRLVGGMDTLDKIEQIKVTDKDRPIQDVRIVSATVFVDPFEEIDSQIRQEREASRNESESSREVSITKSSVQHEHETVVAKGVGALIDLKSIGKPEPNNTSGAKDSKKKKTVSNRFGDFSEW
jgi:peptidyl-prolyl cis-trans isomerase-like protein 2